MKTVSPYRRIWGRDAAIADTALGVLIALPVLGLMSLSMSNAMAASPSRARVNLESDIVEIYGVSGEKVSELTPSKVWPSTGYVSDEFHAYDSVRRWLGLGRHTGIDIAANVGTPVVSFMAGTVTVVDVVDNDACGKNIKIDHGNNVESIYCHLSAASVGAGAPVVAGEVIGRVGNTGVSTGPHVHFQVNVAGSPVNPRTFMAGEPAAQ